MNSADQILYNKLYNALSDYLPAADTLHSDITILVAAGKDAYHRILFLCGADVSILDFFAELAVNHSTATVLFTIPLKQEHLDDILKIIDEVVPKTVSCALLPQKGNIN